MADKKAGEANKPPKKKMVRSPNSPALSLSDALTKAKIIYDAEKKIPTTPEVMLGHLGYETAESGSAGRTFSALRQYGLITEATDGKYRISDSSFRYFELPEDDPERQEILRAAALKPALFKELIDRHKDGVLPSDANLRSHLVLEKSFNPNTVEDFIRIFRQTIAVAKPFEGGYTAPDAGEPEGESTPAGGARMQPPTGSPHVGSEQRSFGTGTVIPVDPNKLGIFTSDGRPLAFRKSTELAFKLSRGSEARVTILGDASQEAIEKLCALLGLQKDTFPTAAEIATEGNYRAAVWKNKDHDQPVTVTGELGKGPDGRNYLKVAESNIGIPEDEVEFEDAKAKGAA